MKRHLHVLTMLLLSGSLCFSLLCAEGVLWLFPDLLPEGARIQIHWAEQTNKPYAAHPYIGYLPAPAAFDETKNSAPDVQTATGHDIWGERNLAPWPEQADIVAVGDSMTYSQMASLEQAWTTLLDRSLPCQRVVTLGLIGAAPQQYFRIYKTFGLALAPKVLLVGLFPGNDLSDADRFDLWWSSEREQSYLEFGYLHAAPGLKGWLPRLRRKSYLLTLLAEVWKSYQEGQFLRGETLHLASGDQIQLVPRFLARIAALNQPERREFRLVLQTLERMHHLAQVQGTTCLVLIFPSKEEVYLPLMEKEAADLAIPWVAELHKRGIAYLDLGPVFRQRAAAGEALFWKVDGHPNAHGYALIAEAVRVHLKEYALEYNLGTQKNSTPH